MVKIARDPGKCSQEPYDLVIVGGGIYGIMLSFEAVRRNLRPLLLEKNDFINATSLNHLRTVHGGVRYLQSLDLLRFKESVAERKWFLKYLPQFVNVVPCLMPLYGKGLYRNSIFRIGLLLNDILSFNRNISIDKEQHLSRCKVINPEKTRELFPTVDQQGLTGSALWFDATVEEYQRLMMELIKLAVTSGATVLNYVHAAALFKENDCVAGVQAVDRETGKEYEFKAPIVINAAGPWCREVAAAFDRDHVSLFKKRLLVWNVLFNKEALSNHALGLSPLKGGGHNYFFHPWKNRLLVGTGEIEIAAASHDSEFSPGKGENNQKLLQGSSDASRDGFLEKSPPGRRRQSEKETIVPAEVMENFIKDINTAVPGLKLTEADIQRVYSGILPAEENGTMTKREKIFDHSKNGGPKGLFSISGIKFTTSRLVADKTLNRVFPKAKKIPHEKILEKAEIRNLYFDYDWDSPKEEDLTLLKEIIENESVLHLSDLILRRTSLGDHPERAIKILPKIRPIFDWGDNRWEIEIDQLKDFFASGGQGGAF
ncbi:MAG: FAD-dependent oxidoreductase [Candidatus Aminicenantes bacterium]|jgi:glycerol-3-phosphate dehydrogenase